MQIESENASQRTRQADAPPKPSKVTDRLGRELLDPACPLTLDDLNRGAEFRKKAEANGWGPLLRRLHSPWSLGRNPKAAVSSRWESSGRRREMIQNSLSRAFGPQTPECSQLG